MSWSSSSLHVLVMEQQFVGNLLLELINRKKNVGHHQAGLNQSEVFSHLNLGFYSKAAKRVTFLSREVLILSLNCLNKMCKLFFPSNPWEVFHLRHQPTINTCQLFCTPTSFFVHLLARGIFLSQTHNTTHYDVFPFPAGRRRRASSGKTRVPPPRCPSMKTLFACQHPEAGATALRKQGKTL